MQKAISRTVRIKMYIFKIFMNLVDNHHPVTDNMALNMQTISNALANIDRRVTYYAGNIKRQKQLTALTHHHFVLPDCDETENLSSPLVFVQFIGLKMGGNFDHFLICKSCNFDKWSD